MFRNILLATAIVLALAITAVLVLAAAKPDEFSVQRSATLDAPAEVLFDLVDDFRRWPEWSPWEDRDPDMVREFSGAERGVGAVYSWDGNDEAGAGRMEILASQRPSHLLIRLDFLRPMNSTTTTTFAFQPVGGQTHVEWSMRGPNTLPFKIMQVFFDMDTRVGGDFQTGLMQLEAAAMRQTVSGDVEPDAPEAANEHAPVQE